jgi:hypothetical protein
LLGVSASSMTFDVWPAAAWGDQALT